MQDILSTQKHALTENAKNFAFDTSQTRWNELDVRQPLTQKFVCYSYLVRAISVIYKLFI